MHLKMVMFFSILIIVYTATTEAFGNAGREVYLKAFCTKHRLHQAHKLSSVEDNITTVSVINEVPTRQKFNADITARHKEYEFENVKRKIESLSTQECKSKLIELISKLKGENEELLQIQTLINELEKRHIAIVTLEFYNMAMSGEWKIIFSTNNVLRKPARGVRLMEFKQIIQPDGLKGNITNLVRWEFAQNGTMFDCYGTFNTECSYEIKEGARPLLNLKDHVINLLGLAIPSNFQELVEKLQLSIPEELFDPNGLGVDTTYLDADLRILRYAGSKRFDGVRNICLRSENVSNDSPAFK